MTNPSSPPRAAEPRVSKDTLQRAKAWMMCVSAAGMVEKANAMAARAAEMAEKVVAARAAMARWLKDLSP